MEDFVPQAVFDSARSLMLRIAYVAGITGAQLHFRLGLNVGNCER